MGNCMETCLARQAQEELHEPEKQRPEADEDDEVRDGDFSGEKKGLNGGGDGGSMRVKIVLTKEELVWLMMQLRSGNGDKRLENMLDEIERGRKKAVCDGEKSCSGWKPSLESIMEIPEFLEMDRSIRL